MTIPFHRDGFALPVCQALLALLSQKPNVPISIWGAALS